jgi:hypothetical protein
MAHTTSSDRPSDVRLRLEPADAANFRPMESWVATPVWTGVDRPDCYAIHLGAGSKGKRLAERYRAAVMAGAVFYDAEVKTDVNGKTYVQAHSRVMGRHANADLRALGF